MVTLPDEREAGLSSVRRFLALAALSRRAGDHRMAGVYRRQADTYRRALLGVPTPMVVRTAASVVGPVATAHLTDGAGEKATAAQLRALCAHAGLTAHVPGFRP